MENLVNRSINPTPAFWAGRRVLVTGHTGFKGAWLTIWLKQMGAEVIGLSDGPLPGRSLYQEMSDRPLDREIFVDIRDHRKTIDTIRDAKPEIILHLAAQSLVRPSYIDPVGTYATNVMGTAHVLDAVRDTDFCRAIVAVTTDKCYENREWPWAYREDEPMGGHDPYSSSKGAAELVISAYRRSYFTDAGVALASVRAGNVLGGGDWAVDRLIPDCIRAFGEGEQVIIRNPNAIRPWQYVLEPLSGYLCLAERMLVEDGDAFTEAWNFGPRDEDCQPVGYLVDQLASVWGDGAGWQLDGSDHPHEATFLRVDISKARMKLGWHPRLDIDTALGWAADWHKAHLGGADPTALCRDHIDRFTSLV